jgi:hypothetical protein
MVFLIFHIMGKLLQTDERYHIISTIPKNTNGLVNLRTRTSNFVLTLLEIDNKLMKVLYKYHYNILGEMCVSFESYFI